MTHCSRRPDGCDMLAEALKQMDHLLADTSSQTSMNQNGIVPRCSNTQSNGHGRPLNSGIADLQPVVNGNNSPGQVDDCDVIRRAQLARAVNLCAELRVALAKLDDRPAFLQLLPAETRMLLHHWFADLERDGTPEMSDGGGMVSPSFSSRAVDSLKVDLVVENSRLRLRLGRMERELQNLEDKFTAAQRRISDLHSCLNERTMEVTGLTSRLARSAHVSPDRSQHQELEKLKHVVELLKMADDEKSLRIEELRLSLNKYKKMEKALIQLKKSEILQNIDLDLDAEVRLSGDEDADSLFDNKTSQEANLASPDEIPEDAAQLRSLSAPRLAAAAHQTLALSSSLPFADSSSSYDNLASYRAVATIKKESFETRRARTPDGTPDETPSPVSLSEKRPPLPPHSANVSVANNSQNGGVGHRRQNRVFASLGKGVLKSQGSRWSRSTPSLVPKVQEVDEGQKSEETEEQERPKSRSPSPTKIRTRKSQPSGLKKFFEKMKRNSQEIDGKLEEFKRSPLRSTVGARLGHSNDLYDANLPFARWDTDRVALWLHVLGLSAYIGNCRHWVKNGEQLLQASTRDLEKELGVSNRFHRKKLQLALQAVTAEKRSPMSDLDHNWVARWLDDIGLPQYKDNFHVSRIDGRLLHNLTVDELVSLKVTNVFHHLSFKRAIQVLRLNDFNQNCLIRRPASDEMPMNCPKEVMLWTNHRVMEWLRSIDLSEYAPNLRGSGVHGALMILEPRFGPDVFATLLSIPASKTLLRRHLTTHFVALVGNTIQQQKRELESRPGYTVLAPNQKIKLRRGIFRNDKPEELVCPLDLQI